MISPKRWFLHSTVALLTAVGGFAEAPRIRTFPLKDPDGLIAPNVKAEPVHYRGRDAVQLTVDGEDRPGIALLPDVDFQDGVIEADFALETTTPPGARYPGFVGIAFRVRPDASHCELFYVRPGNADTADQAMRNHAVQYVSEPDFGWYRLRREWPFVYESHADLTMGEWMKLRIEASGRTARLYLNDSAKPSLVVNGLKGEDLHGGVGLWSYTFEKAYFANVRITTSPPKDVRNASDIAGSWQMRYAGDAGGMAASMELRRDGNKVSGTWSGPLGEGRAITGTWRNGYVELSFAGDWPKESPQGLPGSVNTVMAGWVDGDTAEGRMRVERRSDGLWFAERKK